MVKYKKQHVLDYISGNDLDIDIEELENNKDFMLEVIKLTRDKRMYNYSSNTVKNNCEFIIELLKFFQDDLDFCYKLVYGYLIKNNSPSLKRIELYILISQIFKKSDNLKYKKLSRNCEILIGRYYLKETFQTSLGVIYAKSMGLIKDNTRGFEWIYDKCEESIVVTDYFAKRFAEEIFYKNEQGYTFEEIVHLYFKNSDDLLNKGIKNFLIDYINNYDSFLASYLVTHQNNLDGLIKEILRVIKNWSNYMINLNNIRFDSLIHEIIKDENILCSDFFLNLIIEKLRLEDNYKLYLDNIESDIKNIYLLDSDDLIKIDDLNIKELHSLRKLLDFARNLFMKDVVYKGDLNEFNLQVVNTDYLGKIK